MDCSRLLRVAAGSRIPFPDAERPEKLTMCQFASGPLFRHEPPSTVLSIASSFGGEMSWVDLSWTPTGSTSKATKDYKYFQKSSRDPGLEEILACY